MLLRILITLFLAAIPLFAVDGQKPVAKDKEKEPGQLDPKQFQAMCDKADVVVIGKAYAILTATLDSEPPTPVYTTAKLDAKSVKFLKGREKLGDRPTARVTDTFDELAQPAASLMDKPVFAAFQWNGKELKLKLLSPLNATDHAMITEKFPAAK